MRGGQPIDDALLDKQVSLIQEFPAYADAFFKRLGLDRQLSETEHLRAELEQTKLDIKREKIIAKHTLPEDLAHFVTGKTPEEMDANAKKLSASLEAARKAAGEPAGGDGNNGNGPTLIPPLPRGSGKLESPEVIKARILGRG